MAKLRNAAVAVGFGGAAWPVNPFQWRATWFPEAGMPA